MGGDDLLRRQVGVALVHRALVRHPPEDLVLERLVGAVGRVVRRCRVAEVVGADAFDPRPLRQAEEDRTDRVVGHARTASLDEQRSDGASRPDKIADDPDGFGPERQGPHEPPLPRKAQQGRPILEANVLAVDGHEFRDAGASVVQHRENSQVAPGSEADASGGREQGDALDGREDAPIRLLVELRCAQALQPVLAGEALLFEATRDRPQGAGVRTSRDRTERTAPVLGVQPVSAPWPTRSLILLAIELNTTSAQTPMVMPVIVRAVRSFRRDN
jgi:hypothetical protein